MNLTTDPWIPVVAASGRKQTLSLRELFETADEIRDLSAQPHEKIALLRLLICITQAALDGPETEDDWKLCRNEIQPAAQRYLEKWEASFELFGEGPRFLQMPGLKAAKEEGAGNPATKLDLTLASGNNPTFFDNAAGNSRLQSPGRIALTLLAFQCFSPGGRIGVAKWNGQDTPGAGSSNHAPCTPSSMLHTFLLGPFLLETIHLNLLNKEDAGYMGMEWGTPIWEKPVTAAGDKEAIANATMSYLGRLAPLSRSVRLNDNGRNMILANGLEYPMIPAFREPAATIILREDKPAPLGASLGRSVWRQLGSIAVKARAEKDTISGPRALNNLDEDSGCILWIGALATDKAKIEDVLESAYDLPPGMFHDEGRKMYEEGVGLAESWQGALSRSVKAYASALKLEPAPYDRARQYFWTTLEQSAVILLRLAGAPREVGDLKTSEWGKRVKAAAHASFDFACPHQTPRQIEAYSLGLQNLNLRKPTKDSASPAKKKSKKTA